MTDQDPAFLWETEALRSAAHRMAEAEIDDVAAADDERRWVTLREASRATGIPVETLRKWARRETIPTYLRSTDLGTTLRMVDLDGVERRAAELGRPTTSADQPAVAPASVGPATEPSAAAVAANPPGTMIVPIDAWNKMLNQLGNLHEAGQHLAEARERAVKAETEARFLRERLAELRRESAVQPPVPSTPAAEPPPDPAPSPELAAPPPETVGERASPPPEKVGVPPEKVGVPPEKVWQFFVRRFRDRKQG